MRQEDVLAASPCASWSMCFSITLRRRGLNQKSDCGGEISGVAVFGLSDPAALRESKCTLNCSLSRLATRTRTHSKTNPVLRNPQRDFFAAVNPRSSGWDIKRRSLKSPPQGCIGLINFVTLTRTVRSFILTRSTHTRSWLPKKVAPPKSQTNRSSITRPVTNLFFSCTPVTFLQVGFLVGTCDNAFMPIGSTERRETTAIMNCLCWWAQGVRCPVWFVNAWLCKADKWIASSWWQINSFVSRKACCCCSDTNQHVPRILIYCCIFLRAIF